MSSGADQAIVFVTDAAYAPAAFFAARQALRAVPDTIDVVIAATDEVLAEQIASAEPRLRAVSVPQDLLPDNIPRNAWRPKTMYARLVLEKVLDTAYRRILYLDSDVWLAEGIGRLLALDLKGKSIAAARDIADVQMRRGFAEYRTKLGLSPHQPYFNSGVMLIDIARYRARNIGPRALDYIVGGGYRGLWHDQSALNHAARDDFLEISPLWNWHASSDRKDWSPTMEPMVVHFTGRKPWNDPFGVLDGAYGEAMERDLAGTPWADFVQSRGDLGSFKYWKGFLHHRILRAKRLATRRRRRVSAMHAYLRVGRFADVEQGLISPAE